MTSNQTDTYIDQVISDGNGGAFICWETESDVLVQHINNAGAKVWASSGVLLSNTGGDGYISTDGAGGIFATWSDYRDDPVDYNPITYIQRVNSAGSKALAAAGVKVLNSTGLNAPTGIISDNAGGAIISIIDSRNSNYDPVAHMYDNIDIYAQRVNSSGAPVWAVAGVPVCTQAGNQANESSADFPNIVADGSGGVIIAWEDYRNDPDNGNGDTYNEDIFCQRLNSNGSPMWTTNGVALCTQTDDQFLVTLMPDGTGGAVAAWFDGRNNSDNVYAQNKWSRNRTMDSQW